SRMKLLSIVLFLIGIVAVSAQWGWEMERFGRFGRPPPPPPPPPEFGFGRGFGRGFGGFGGGLWR
ncbi:hypothetical protein V3C99_010249, partial [Haemonchus contortus]|uniref:Glycine rich protein n=1 Tax=Haemonchus contortus TaxID=6289 RepID=A0A7I4YIF2_HAECO